MLSVCALAMIPVVRNCPITHQVCSGFNDCHLWDLFAVAGDCTSDSTYILHVEFNFNNFPGDSVVITANGNEIGHFSVNEGNFFIEDFPVLIPRKPF
jgi:hypothetical protein